MIFFQSGEGNGGGEKKKKKKEEDAMVAASVRTQSLHSSLFMSIAPVGRDCV